MLEKLKEKMLKLIIPIQYSIGVIKDMKDFNIHGIGTDIVKISRIEQAVLSWGDRFLGRVFTESERDYCFKKARPYSSLAARFAAKEAFVKALSVEVPVSFKEIETINDKNGAPVLRLHGRVAEILKEFCPNGVVHLSLSHDGDYAVAFVVIEKKLEVL